MPGAEAIKSVVAGRFVVRLALFVDGEAIGELGASGFRTGQAVVGQNGVDFEREAFEEAGEKAGRGIRSAIGQDLEIDKAGGAVDRNIGVRAAAVERRQIFDVDVDETGRIIGVKDRRRGFFGGETGRDSVPLQAAVDGAARQLGVDTAPHRLDDVIKRQGEAAAQLDRQGFFPLRHGSVRPVRPGRAVGHLRAGFPPRHSAAVNAELASRRGVGCPASLGVGAGTRGGGGVGVELEIHQPASPSIGRLRRRGCVQETLAPVGPQAPPARRAARLCGGRGAGARVPPMDYRDELRFLSQPLLQPFDSMPQPGAIAPTLRDETLSRGRRRKRTGTIRSVLTTSSAMLAISIASATTDENHRANQCLPIASPQARRVTPALRSICAICAAPPACVRLI